MTKPRLSLAFSSENLLANWYYPDTMSQVSAAIAGREKLCETGERPLKMFTFHVREDYRPVLRHGSYELEFSRLAWSRMAKWFGLSRDFVRLRLKGGKVGKRSLEDAINTMLQQDWKITPLFMLFRHSDERDRYTIRDMLRSGRDREIDVPDLWEYLESHELTRQRPSRLALFRLSDYAHQFRYHLGEKLVEPGEIGVMIDACLSIGRKLYYAQGSYYWIEGDQVVLARADMKELNVKEVLTEPQFLPDAADAVAEAMLDGIPTFQDWIGDAVKMYRDDDELTTFARVIKTLRNRKLPVPHRTEVIRRLVARSAQSPLDMSSAIRAVSESANASDHPEMGNRLERCVYDLKTGKSVKPSRHDLGDAAKYLRVDEPPPAYQETRQLGSSSTTVEEVET